MNVCAAYFGRRRILYGMYHDENGVAHRLLYYVRVPLPLEPADSVLTLAVQLACRAAKAFSAELRGGEPMLEAAMTQHAAETGLAAAGGLGADPRLEAAITPAASEQLSPAQTASVLTDSVSVQDSHSGTMEPQPLSGVLTDHAAALDAHAEYLTDAAAEAIHDARGQTVRLPMKTLPPAEGGCVIRVSARPAQLPITELSAKSGQTQDASAALEALDADDLTEAACSVSGCRVGLTAEPQWFELDPTTGILTIYQAFDYSASNGTLTIN